MGSLDVAVIGSGPNGLTAATLLAELGLSVQVFERASSPGGGARTEELMQPGVWHDICSAVHPTGAGSPVFKKMKLDDHGLNWLQPEIPLVQTFGEGDAIVANRSIEETAAGLGKDAERYVNLFSKFEGKWDQIIGEIFQPTVHMPKHPLLFAKFGMKGFLSGEKLAKSFSEERTRTFIAGLGSHTMISLENSFTAGVAMMFALSLHEVGWPIAEGGSKSIVNALINRLESFGGKITLDTDITSFDQLPEARAYVFDTAAKHLATIASDQLSSRYRRRLSKFHYGSAAYKIDYILSEPVPWENKAARKAGTIHVGGSYDEIEAALVDAESGTVSDKPFLIVAQPTLIDKSRTSGGKEVLWVYAHVPNGWNGEFVEQIERQLERFAPGFRDIVISKRVHNPADLEAHNPNYVGGDIASGAFGGVQALFRPVLAIDPYSTSDDSIYLASSSTPPGAGVHGMCGYNAAKRVAKKVFGKTIKL